MAFRADLFEKHYTDGTKFWNPAVLITNTIGIPGVVGLTIAGTIAGIGGVPALVGFGVAAAGFFGSSAILNSSVDWQLNVEDKLENATTKATGSVSNLVQASRRRKAINESLESFTIAGVKADYKVVFDIDGSGDNELLKGFLIRIHGIKEWSEKTCFMVNENVFASCFQIDSIDKGGILEEISVQVDEETKPKGKDSHIDKDTQELLAKLIDKYGVQGTCTLTDGAKLFITDNAVQNNNKEYAAFIESPDTKKPNLNNPIFIDNKEILINALSASKK